MPRKAISVVPRRLAPRGHASPCNKFHSVGPAALSHLCIKKTFAAYVSLIGLISTPNKERGAAWPIMAFSCLLWTQSVGPAGWDLYPFGKPIACNERSLFWVLCQPRLGAHRGACSTAPTFSNNKKGSLFQPPAKAQAWPSLHPTG